jgi:hypothetical protein
VKFGDKNGTYRQGGKKIDEFKSKVAVRTMEWKCKEITKA